MDDDWHKRFVSPFGQRPWMTDVGAAVSSKKIITLRGIVAGAITGSIEVRFTYPTEYVKTQLQLDEKGVSQLYTGFVDCIKKTMKTNGFIGLYRGLCVTLHGSVPKSAVRFGAFETIKGAMVDEHGQLHLAGKLLAGFGAGVCEAILVVTPIETVKVKFINDQRYPSPRFKSFTHGVIKIIQTEGIFGIYRGVTATILKQSTSQAIRFYFMETFMDMYTGDDRNKHVPKVFVAAFGALAGAVSVFANTPTDVVKTRMQSLEASKYKSTVDCIVKIWKNEGAAAFYKGTVPRLIRVCIDVAFTFTVYDTLLDLFDMFWNEDD